MGQVYWEGDAGNTVALGILRERRSGGNLGEECGTICRLMTDDVIHSIVCSERMTFLIGVGVAPTSRLFLC